jgi:hypothetical protein
MCKYEISYETFSGFLLKPENLLILDSKTMWEICSKHLPFIALALKGVPINIQNHFLSRGMSKNRAEIVNNDMALIGPVLLSDINEIWQKILEDAWYVTDREIFNFEAV